MLINGDVAGRVERVLGFPGVCINLLDEIYYNMFLCPKVDMIALNVLELKEASLERAGRGGSGIRRAKKNE